MNEALRLAELLKPGAVIPIDIETTATLCNELRRLHALNAELVEALREMLDLWAEDPAYGHDTAYKAQAVLKKVEGKV